MFLHHSAIRPGIETANHGSGHKKVVTNIRVTNDKGKEVRVTNVEGKNVRVTNVWVTNVLVSNFWVTNVWVTNVWVTNFWVTDVQVTHVRLPLKSSCNKAWNIDSKSCLLHKKYSWSLLALWKSVSQCMFKALCIRSERIWSQTHWCLRLPIDIFYSYYY